MDNKAHQRMRYGIPIFVFLTFAFATVSLFPEIEKDSGQSSSIFIPTTGREIAKPLIQTGQSQDETGSFPKWSNVELSLKGPASAGDNSRENPFKIEARMVFTSPGGHRFNVAAFYDGDGAGGMKGNVWKVRFSPSEAGTWTYLSESSHPLLNGQGGQFAVTDPAGCKVYAAGGLPDFSCMGRLMATGERYLKFSDGPFWLKGGVDEPEDFLAPDETAGFDSKRKAVDELAGRGVNSIYMLLHNIDGDEKNVWPWVGADQDKAKANHEIFDLAKLAEWEDLFTYIQSKGLVLHLVLEDDSAWTGFNRDLYYREMTARFGHHNGLIWNIAEEYNENYSPEQVKGFAQKIRDLDPYDHPITVHHAGDLKAWEPFLGDPRFDLTSFQTDPQPQNMQAAAWYMKVGETQHLIPISFDETGQLEATQRDLARKIVWSVYLGGGNYEMFTQLTSGYGDFAGHFEDMRRARAFLEYLPFHTLQPLNSLLSSGQAYIMAKPGEHYVAYLPQGGQVTIDLAQATGEMRAAWYNPQTGEKILGEPVQGKAVRTFKAPNIQDWVLYLSKSCSSPPALTTLFPSGSSPDLGPINSNPSYIPLVSNC